MGPTIRGSDKKPALRRGGAFPTAKSLVCVRRDMDDELVRTGGLLGVIGGTLALYDSIVAVLGEVGVSLVSGVLMLAASVTMAVAWARTGRGTGSDANA